MEDIGKILEAAEYCLTNGKCAECKFSKGRMFATCRYLMEDVFELLIEQEEQIKNRDESLEKAREEIKWLRGIRLQALLKKQEAVEAPLDAFGHPYCPKCKVLVYQTWHYCPHCGQAVKWE